LQKGSNQQGIVKSDSLHSPSRCVPSELCVNLKKGDMKYENKKVTVAGAGTLGSQIAWQTAFYGFNVTVYDPFDESIETAKSYLAMYSIHY